MKKKYGSKLSIAAWVHSHVEGVECCFSSVDLHTQFTWSQVFPDILGLVFEIDQDGLPAEYDFYGLTTQGITELRKCRKPGSDGHVECDKKSYYTSKLHLIDPIDIHLEVHDFFQMSYPNEQLFENEWPTIEESTKRKLKPVKPSAHEEEVEIQDQEDITNSYQSQDHEKECEGCKKTYNIDTFFKHFRRAKKCKEKYGDRYDDMIKERRENYKKAHNFKNTQKRNEKAKQIYAENSEARKEKAKQIYAENRETKKEKAKQIYAENKEARKENFKQNYAENREARNKKAKQDHVKNKDRNNQRDKERRKIAKIESKEFEKRLQKFKKETKYGPSFACQCCQRTLFYRGMCF